MTGRYSFGGENLINLGTSSWKDKLDKTDQVEKKIKEMWLPWIWYLSSKGILPLVNRGVKFTMSGKFYVNPHWGYHT